MSKTLKCTLKGCVIKEIKKIAPLYPILNRKTVQIPFLCNTLPIYWFFESPPPPVKTGVFSEVP